MDDMIQVRVNKVRETGVKGSYFVILDNMRDVPDQQVFFVTVGESEAQSISLAFEQLFSQRPTTHDLAITMMKVAGLTLREVRIEKFERSVYYSKLILFDGKKEISIDSRTSDALVLALREKCPIYTTKEILYKDTHNSGSDDIKTKKKDSEPGNDIRSSLEKWIAMADDDALTKRLADSVAREDYESAKLLQNELLRRNKQD